MLYLYLIGTAAYNSTCYSYYINVDVLQLNHKYIVCIFLVSFDIMYVVNVYLLDTGRVT